MTVAAVSMVKDEADIIESSVRHIADEVDFLIVADNLSTDGTRDILDKLAAELNLIVTDDPNLAHYQAEKMTGLARLAARHGATWIVPFDADECWVALGNRIRDDLEDSDADVVTAQLYNHFPSAVDPAGDDPMRTIIWRTREPAALPKVAFRWREDARLHEGNHGVSVPGDTVVTGGLQVHHFPYRTADQFIRKARNGSAALAATDLPEDIGAHWRGYGRILDERGEPALREVFDRYFWNLSPADAGLVLDPAPYMRWR